MKAEGVSFRHAVELLRADAPLSTTAKPASTAAIRQMRRRRRWLQRRMVGGSQKMLRIAA
jgi:hypothetical protein